MKSLLFVVLLCTVCVYAGEIRQYGGTLFLDSIQANVDPVDGSSIIQIEGLMFDDSSLKLDFIEGRDSEFGVEIEDSELLDASMFIPDDLMVGDSATFTGLLSANGGIVCDDGQDDDETNTFSYSWKLADDTGCLNIVGSLAANGGIKMDDTFWVENDTGRTYIKGLTRPDGGLDVNSVFDVSEQTGDVHSDGNLSVEGDIFFGTEAAEERTVARFASNSLPVNGGPTTLVGQDSQMRGGNVVLVPGLATSLEGKTSHGKIIYGVAGSYDLGIERFQVTDDNGVTDAGNTILSGQDAGGNGGNTVIAAGNSQTNNGGDINLIPGITNGVFGEIVLGGASFDGDYNNRENYDYIATRPLVGDAADAGDTFFVGQNVDQSSDAAGHLMFAAGSVMSSSGNGGHLYISGGNNEQTQDTGIVYLGNNAVNNANVLRPDFTDAGDAGNLFFQGQDSSAGNGGDLWFRSGNGGASGDLYLQTTTLSGTGAPGIIQLGNTNTPDLMIMMPGPMVGSDLLISGQEATSAGTTGGSLNFASGNGRHGGRVTLMSGSGVNGGNLNIAAGVGSDGVDITINAGPGTGGAGAGGSIYLKPGCSGRFAEGVDIVFNPGTSIGSTNGMVQITNNANLVHFDNIPFVVDGSTFTINDANSGNVLAFDASNVANGVLQINGAGLLTAPQLIQLPTIMDVNPYVRANMPQAVTNLRAGIDLVITAMVTHGLVGTI